MANESVEDSLDLLLRYDCAGYLLVSSVIYNRTPQRRTYTAIKNLLKKHLFLQILSTLHAAPIKDEQHLGRVKNDFMLVGIDNAVDLFFLYTKKKDFFNHCEFHKLLGPVEEFAL